MRPEPTWKDITSYSRGEVDRTPRVWSITLGNFRLVVLCGHINYPNRWVCSLVPLWDQYDLELDAPTTSTNREEAKSKALRLVVETLQAAITDACGALERQPL